MKNVENRVMSLVNKLLLNKQSLNKETNFKDLGFDSLDSIELLMETEKEFNIQIKDEDWENVETIQDVINLIPIE